MIKIIALCLVSLLLLALDCALMRCWGLSVARADVGVVVVVFFALRCATLEGALGSAVVGYFVDVLSGQPSGLYVFTAVLTFLFARLIAPFVEIRSAMAFALLACGIDVLHNLTAWALSHLGTIPEANRNPMLWALPLTALLTLLAGLASWWVLKTIDLFFKKPETGLLR